jgi:hypothetical protein
MLETFYVLIIYLSITKVKMNYLFSMIYYKKRSEMMDGTLDEWQTIG